MSKIVDFKQFKESEYYIDKADQAYHDGCYFDSMKYLRISEEDQKPTENSTLSIGQMLIETAILDAAKRCYLKLFFGDYHNCYASVGLAILSWMSNDWDAAIFYARKALDDCSDNVFFMDMYRSLFASTFKKRIERITDKALAQRSRFSLIVDNRPIPDFVLDDDMELTYDRQLKLKSIESFNSGDNTMAVKYAREAVAIFGPSIGAAYLVDFYKKFTVNETGKVFLDPENNFEIPDELREEYTKEIATSLTYSIHRLDKKLVGDKYFKRALTWLFEAEETELVFYVLKKLESGMTSNFSHFLQERLLLSDYENDNLTYFMLYLLICDMPSAMFLYKVDGCVYDYKPPHFNSLLRKFPRLPVRFCIAYYKFITAYQVCRPLSEVHGLNIAERTIRKMVHVGLDKFKSSGAVAFTMLSYATDVSMWNGANLINLFETTKATTDRYKMLLDNCKEEF